MDDVISARSWHISENRTTGISHERKITARTEGKLHLIPHTCVVCVLSHSKKKRDLIHVVHINVNISYTLYGIPVCLETDCLRKLVSSPFFTCFAMNCIQYIICWWIVWGGKIRGGGFTLKLLSPSLSSRNAYQKCTLHNKFGYIWKHICICIFWRASCANQQYLTSGSNIFCWRA